MAKIAAKGTKISYLVGSTYTDIAQVKEISYDLGGAPDKVDVTTLDEATNYRSYVTTFLQTGQVTLRMVYDPANSTHDWLRDNGGSSATFKVTHVDAGNATEVFSATVGGMQVTATADGALEATITLEITGASTITQ